MNRVERTVRGIDPTLELVKPKVCGRLCCPRAGRPHHLHQPVWTGSPSDWGTPHRRCASSVLVGTCERALEVVSGRSHQRQWSFELVDVEIEQRY